VSPLTFNVLNDLILIIETVKTRFNSLNVTQRRNLRHLYVYLNKQRLSITKEL